MATLPNSGLETISYGVSGWSGILTTDLELLDAKLGKVMLGNAKVLGIGTVTDPTVETIQALTDSSTGTPSTTIAVTSDTVADDNFASLTKEIMAAKVDIENLRSVVIALQAELRISTGNGVLGG